MQKRLKPTDSVASGETNGAAALDVLALLDLAPVLGRDMQDRIIHWGHGAQALFGFTAEEALGQVSYRLLNTVFPRPLEELRASLRGQGRWQGELTHVHKDGYRLVVASEWALQCSPQGQPCAILEVDQDLTESKKAQREQATLAAVVANSPDAIIGEDLDGVITSWNPGAEGLFGYRAGEVLGRHISLLAAPGKSADMLELVHRARNGETARRVATERVRKDGRRLMVSVAVSPIRGADGRVIGIAKVAHDITELRQAREKLQRNEKRLELHNAAAERLLLSADPSSALSEVYERMAEYFQIDGFIEFDLNAAGDRLELAACRAFVETRHTGITRLALGQGVAGRVAQTRQPIVLSQVQDSTEAELQPLRDLGIAAYACEPLVVGERLLGTLSVASRRRQHFDEADQAFFRTLANYLALAKERRRLLNELQQHASKLERTVAERTAQLVEANTQLQTFAYTAAHDLRSPLRSIDGYAQLVRAESDHLSPMAQSGLQKLGEATQRLSALLQNLLEYSKLNRADLRLEAVALDQVLEQALSFLQEDLRRREAEISIQRPLPTVRAHFATLVLVVTNLLSNALKFTPAGLRPKVRLWSEPVAGRVRLSVQDSGIGMDEAELQRLFEPFHRLGNPNEYPGTGLGLAIVRRAVERMGGQVGVASTLGQGSCFWVELNPAA